MSYHRMGYIPDNVIIKPLRDTIQLLHATLLEIVMKNFPIV